MTIPAEAWLSAIVVLLIYYLHHIAKTLEAIRFMIFKKLERDGFFGDQPQQ